MTSKQSRLSLSRFLRRTPSRAGNESTPPSIAQSQTGALRGGKEDTILGTTETILKLLQDVVKLVDKVPYIEGIAGILGSMIEIRQEMKDSEKYAQQVLDDVLNLSKNILFQIKRISESPRKDFLMPVESDLKEYKDFLDDLTRDLKSYQSRQWLQKLTDRKSDKLKEWERKIDKFQRTFVISRMVNIEMVIANPPSNGIPSTTSVLSAWRMTPKPTAAVLVGREKEMELLISHIGTQEPLRIAILGAGGMGKTTLVLHFLHKKEVFKQYPKQLFISCEGKASLDQLLLDIATAIRICPEQLQEKEHIQDAVLEELQKHSAIICVDNMETLWEPSEIQGQLEQFLNCLSNIPGLGLLITLRGNQRPNGVTWSHPLLRPLSPLKREESLQTFQNIVQQPATDAAQNLIQEVGGIPLAVTLIAHLIRDEIESSESLWSRWQHEKTSVLHTAKNRLSSLDISIKLSFNSPRMTPEAKSLLYLLSYLPDGFSNSVEMLKKADDYIPQFREALKVLRTVALAQIEETLTSSRIQILSPIKHFCLQLKDLDSYLEPIIAFYRDLIQRYCSPEDTQAYSIIIQEFYNISCILQADIGKGQYAIASIQAVIAWTRWSIFLGRPSDALIKKAIRHCEDIGLQGSCYNILGRLFIYRRQMAEAEEALQKALALDKEANNILNQADDLGILGEFYTDTGQLKKAENILQKALELNNQAQNATVQAESLGRLGELYTLSNQLKKAEKSLQEALELHKQNQDVLGQAGDLYRLGYLYMQRNQLEEAERSFQEALVLHKQKQSVQGQTVDLGGLGNIYMQRDQLDKAEKAFGEALGLNKDAQNVQGQTFALGKLGHIYMQRYQLEEAEKAFGEALELDKEALNVQGQAIAMGELGHLYICRDQLEEAEKAFREALELYKEAQNVQGQTFALGNLGDIYMQRDQLEEAEKTFGEALALALSSVQN
ncbi:hypothetical protein M422DRAFT_258235 [Sphaerobolus stellatus SS14]|uniref:NB-ARC domain-containing protein n=1 Tax=Sphaerobolus stellatus (strain SS14) TaxID=990650 RepID=A0A0C9VMZ7_SPHS4|nr:hypothetical protein M422DRAFT_258235 [Sphaerobolus stellatus SS14]